MQLNVGGLITGLDTNGIIEAILETRRIPQLNLQFQVERATQKQTALLALSAQTLATSSAANQLSKPGLFDGAVVTSSNPDILAAIPSEGFSLKGSFSFTPTRLASSDQFTSGGFSSATALAGTGQVSIEVGKGSLSRETELSALNGGNGISNGSFRITDKSGGNADIDLQGLVSLNEVITKINTAGGVDVQATLNAAGDGIDLQDISGGGGTLTVFDFGSGTAASDLGIAGSTAGTTLNGSSLVSITGDTLLSQLNDGRGVRVGSGNDLNVLGSDGTTSIGVDIDSAVTVQDVIDLINAQDPNFIASISPDGRGLTITDTLGGGGTTTITDGFVSAATDLGLENSVAKSGGTGGVVGRDLIAGLNTVLLSSLNGGNGVTQGSIDITDRNGALATIDLSTAQSLQDVIEAINSNGVAQVQASVAPGGTGLVIQDISGGSGNLIINENGSTTAADLGIENGAGSTSNTLFGTNLQLQYINENTTLDSLGINQGKIRIINRLGASFDIDLTQSNNTTLGSIAEEISAITGGTVTARVNDTGDGLILEDTTTGSLQLRVEDIDSALARDLNLAGSFDSNTIDGSFETTLTIDPTDTVQDLITKINDAGGDFTAALINDGSSSNPFRINLVSNVTGSSGKLAFDFSQLGISFTQTAKAQDALLLYGDPNAGGTPLLIRSSDNTFNDVLPGLDLQIFQTSNTPITVSASNNDDQIVAQVQTLVDGVNSVLGAINDLTKFNAESFESGLLFGDTTVRNHERSIQRRFSARISGLDTPITSLAQLGVRVTETGQYFFDDTVLRDALAADPDGVKEFFTRRDTVIEGTGTEIVGIGFAVTLEEYFETFTNKFDGTIKNRTDALDLQILDLNDRIERIDEQIVSEEERLIREFARMESLVNQYQQIGARLSSLSQNLVQPRGRNN